MVATAHASGRLAATLVALGLALHPRAVRAQANPADPPDATLSQPGQGRVPVRVESAASGTLHIALTADWSGDIAARFHVPVYAMDRWICDAPCTLWVARGPFRLSLQHNRGAAVGVRLDMRAWSRATVRYPSDSGARALFALAVTGSSVLGAGGVALTVAGVLAASGVVVPDAVFAVAFVTAGVGLLVTIGTLLGTAVSEPDPLLHGVQVVPPWTPVDAGGAARDLPLTGALPRLALRF
jgi:hypothetical protein